MSISKVITIFLFISLGEIFAVATKSTPTSAVGNKKFGLGISLLSPTGITGKYWLDDKKSIEGTLGLGYQEKWAGYLHAVFLYNLIELKPNVSFYIGGGISLSQRREKFQPERGYFIESESSFLSPGVRIPVGINYRNLEKNFEVFGEIALNLYLGSRTGLGPGISFGARYYF